MRMKHPAAVTQFGYFPLVMSYIEQASNQISFVEIQQNLIRKNYELQAKNYDFSFDDGEIPQPPSRQGKGRQTDMYNQLSQILNELIHFGLVEVKNQRNNNSLFGGMIPAQNPGSNIAEHWVCHLTSKGHELLQLANGPKILEFKARYFNLMFNYFPIVSKFLHAVHNGGKDSVVLPHVTAQQLGLEELDLENPRDLSSYLDEVTESVLSTYKDQVKTPKEWVDRDFRLRRPKLEEKILKTSQQYRESGKKYPRFLIIARIRDYCVSYFAHVLTGDKTISGRSLEALSSRLAKMEIMGYSDYIYKGRLLFLCSWVVPLLNASADRQVSNDYKKFSLESLKSETQAYCLVMHQPEYPHIKNKFEESLVRTFDKLYFRQFKQFVSIPDLRENVCLDLKISAKSFDKLMKNAYNDSFYGESSLEITLAYDPGYVEYGLEQWHRVPLRLEGRPITVAKIKKRVTP